MRGELGDRDALRAFEHMRGCPSCREAFRDEARRAGPAADSERRAEEWVRPVAGEVAHEPAAVTTGTRALVGLGAAQAAPTKRRLLIVVTVLAGAALLVVLNGWPLAGRRGDAPDDRVPAALMEGAPVCLGPTGAQVARPTEIRALLPPAVRTAVLLFLDADGRVRLEMPVAAGEAGVTITEAEISAPAGTLRAGRLSVPFPESTRLALTAGQVTGVAIAVPGGHVSPSSVFWLAPG